jgi:small-conductance mechanosensitive channel
MYRVRTNRVARLAILLAVTGAAFGSLFAIADGPAPSESETIIAFLNQSILWYHQVTAQQQLVREPSDAVVFNENRQIADQVARMSFDFARARAQVLAKSGTAPQEPVTQPNQNLLDLAAKTDQTAKETQQELAGLKQKAAAATGQKLRVLESQIAEVQSEVDLLRARQETLHNMLDFSSTTAASTAKQAGLTAQVEALTNSLPASATAPNPTGTNAAASAASPVSAAPVTVTADERKGESTGIYARLVEFLATRKKMGAIDSALEATDSLAQTGKVLRTPLMAHARELTSRGDELAAQPDSAEPDKFAQQRKELDGLTAQFKQSSAALLPLGKQAILLELYKRNLLNWRNTVQIQYSAQGKGLLWRLAMLGIVLALVFALSDLWRRMTFRYVQDAHRRHQFLLLRRIVVICVVLMVIVFAFASGLGTIATFAGLTTAGVAVSLQNVILSVVGYFFLIGKYGVRVGDRIQVSGVIGDVMDIGLVRLHIMEVSGIPGPRPTGRVVAFSNAVVFQPAGIFKQIPGTSFRWHEVTLTLPPGSDYRKVEKIMLETVNRIFAEYRDQIESQRKSMERVLASVTIESFDPESRLGLTLDGLQVIVRYAVDLVNAAEIDDRVIREVLEATGREPQIQFATPARRKENEEQGIQR